jgi:hypothetical protein
MKNDENGLEIKDMSKLFYHQKNLRMTERSENECLFSRFSQLFFISENNLKLLRMTERSEKTSKNGLNDCLFLDLMMLVVL